MGVEMAISSAMSVVAVQNHSSPSPQPAREKPLAGPAAAQTRPVATETQLAQSVALPPVVTALTADLAAGRAAAEAARIAYREQQRMSGG